MPGLASTRRWAARTRNSAALRACWGAGRLGAAGVGAGAAPGAGAGAGVGFCDAGLLQPASQAAAPTVPSAAQARQAAPSRRAREVKSVKCTVDLQCQVS